MATKELPGTRFDADIWADSTEIWSGTITDQDGTAVDLTDCTLKLLLKRDVDDSDAEADAEGEVEVVSPAAGTVRASITRDQIEPGEYQYDLKVAFPGDYAIAYLQSAQQTVIHGTIRVHQETTRDAAPVEE